MALNSFGPNPVACNYTASSIFDDSFRICNEYVQVLQTCPTSSVTQEQKLSIAYQTSTCLAAVWAYDADPQYLSNYTDAPPPPIVANASCKYPDFAPILKEACAWDFSQLNVTCKEDQGSNFTQLWTPDTDGWTLCSVQAVNQYWRCTQQKPYNEVAQCVIDNAQKIDWLGQIIIYEGAETCETADHWLLTVAGSIAVSLILSVLQAALGPWVMRKVLKPAWRKIKALICCGKRASPPITDEKEIDILSLEEEYILKANSIMASLGGELLSIFLTIFVIRRFGVGAYMNGENLMWDMFLLFAIRPRVAPFTGLLGFFKGWSQAALGDLVTDSLLSIVAGTSIAWNYFHYTWTTNPNPSAPDHTLKILGVGAIMTCVPMALGWIGACVMAWKKFNIKAGDGIFWAIYGALLLGFGVAIKIFLIVLAMPLIAIWELFCALLIAIKGRKNSSRSTRSRDALHYLKDPLRADAAGFRPSYGVLVFFSWVVNVGNWLFFASYLILEGDAYCPSGSMALSAIWILAPLAVKWPVQALGLYVKKK